MEENKHKLKDGKLSEEQIRRMTIAVKNSPEAKLKVEIATKMVSMFTKADFDRLNHVNEG